MSLPSNQVPSKPARSRWLWLREKALSSRVLFSLVVVLLMLALLWWWRPLLLMPGTQPLVMQGGDPYLRALMRTISASESNVLRPYHVVHGSSLVWSLDQHPNQCESIARGPNKGNCSTAAGRYQLLNSTWVAMSLRYHPQLSADDTKETKFSFEPVYQDQVVYAWLADKQAWRADLSDLLKAGKSKTVLRRLSGTWTSLGYGIESNRMSKELPGIYARVLEEELSRTSPAAQGLASDLEPDPEPEADEDEAPRK